MERIDDLQRNGYRIIQDTDTFCFGMDAVLLSGFAKDALGERLLDMGTGNGIIPLLMAAKTEFPDIFGLEIQKKMAELARRSVSLNSLENRIKIVEGDIKEASKIFPKASFDVITCNPPYMIGSHGLKNDKEPKNIARHEILCTFQDVAGEAATLLKPGGSFYLVHRPFRLPEIMTTLSEVRLEPKRMQLVYPFVDKEPNMVLIQAVRGGKPRMHVEKPLIIYKAPGIYTEEIYEIYGY